MRPTPLEKDRGKSTYHCPTRYGSVRCAVQPRALVDNSPSPRPGAIRIASHVSCLYRCNAMLPTATGGWYREAYTTRLAFPPKASSAVERTTSIAIDICRPSSHAYHLAVIAGKSSASQGCAPRSVTILRTVSTQAGCCVMSSMPESPSSVGCARHNTRGDKDKRRKGRDEFLHSQSWWCCSQARQTTADCALRRRT